MNRVERGDKRSRRDGNHCKVADFAAQDVERRREVIELLLTSVARRLCRPHRLLLVSGMSNQQDLRIERYAHPAEKQNSGDEQQPVAQPPQPAGTGFNVVGDLIHGLCRRDLFSSVGSRC